MKKFDDAYIKTKYILKEIIHEIKKIYKKAYDKIKVKIQEYMAEFKDEDDKMRKSAHSDDEHQEWRAEKIMVGVKYQEVLRELAEILGQIDRNATEILKNLAVDVYYINVNFTIKTVSEHYKVRDLELFDKNTVEKLINQKFKLSSKNQERDRKKINSAVALGIINGESLDEIAERVAKVADMNRVSATRAVATAVTGVLNAGRVAGYRRCEQMGLSVKQRWVSAEDGHTRASHKAINGEIIGVGEVFSNGLEYPADPRGAPAEVYNCRCCTVAVFD